MEKSKLPTWLQKFLDFFKHKPLSFYLCLGAMVVGLVNTIIYAAYSANVTGKFGDHFRPLLFIFLLAATLSCALPMIFPKWKFITLVPVALFSAFFGYYVNDRLIMFEEMINHIYGMMDDGAVLGMVLLIFILDLVSVISVAVATFLEKDTPLLVKKTA